MKTKQYNKVPYVRGPCDLPARVVRMERSAWKRSVPELLSASNTQNHANAARRWASTRLARQGVPPLLERQTFKQNQT